MIKTKFKVVDVDLYYNDESPQQLKTYKCAIGEFNDTCELCEAWDNEIFYWFESKEELDSFKKFDPLGEFTVVSYGKLVDAKF